MQHTHVLITGACSGLGKAFAQECAKAGMQLLLTERPGSPVRSLAGSLSDHYGVETAVFEFDHSDPLALQDNMNAIADRFPIRFLINNAGIGGTAYFTETSVEQIDSIIALNVRSMAITTRILLPKLLLHSRSYMLNVASMAAFVPLAYKTVYPASKAFVSYFSKGLHQEMKDRGLSVSVLYPGAIMTNASVSKRILKLGFTGRMGLLSTDDIAALAIRKTLAGCPKIIPGKANRLNYWLMNMLPETLRSSVVSNQIRKEVA